MEQIGPEDPDVTVSGIDEELEKGPEGEERDEADGSVPPSPRPRVEKQGDGLTVEEGVDDPATRPADERER